jgi:hypothetical protein
LVGGKNFFVAETSFTSRGHLLAETSQQTGFVVKARVAVARVRWENAITEALSTNLLKLIKCGTFNLSSYMDKSCMQPQEAPILPSGANELRISYQHQYCSSVYCMHQRHKWEQMICQKSQIVLFCFPENTLHTW